MGHRWDYFKEGSTVVGVKILERLETEGTTQKETLYRVRRTCCEKEEVLSHDRIQRKLKTRKTGKCTHCTARSINGSGVELAAANAKNPPKVLPLNMPEACLRNVRLLRHVNRRKDWQIYEAQYVCCGKKAEFSRRQIRARVFNQSKYCRSCAISARYAGTPAKPKAPRAERVVALEPYGIKFRPDWQRPSHVPSGEHVLWGDRMS